MKRFVSVISASTLAATAVFNPISITSAMADENMTARAYFSFKFGAGAAEQNSARYGFQLKQSWDRDDDAINPFAKPRSLTVFDFAMDGEGLAKANVLGLDTITVYDIWTGRDRFYQNGEGGGLNPITIGGGIVIGGVILCFVFDWEPCEDSPEQVA